jgi:GNAT superfamily N-acetyltransferase
MTIADIDAAERLWDDAFRTMRARYGLPPIVRTPDVVAFLTARFVYLLDVDPGGAFVATIDEEVAGLALGVVRDDLYVLAQFAVTPRAQGKGLGRALLDAALAYGGGRRAMILCSRDPAAMRRYAAAGFELRPAFAAYGPVRRDALAGGASRVRPGDERDLALAAAVDLEVRGATHGADIAHSLEHDADLLVHDDGGYALVGARPMLLAARSPEIAASLLRAALLHLPPDAPGDMSWITGEQQWAIRVALDAGLELVPHGPVALRGFDRMPAPYLPNGAFG